MASSVHRWLGLSRCPAGTFLSRTLCGTSSQNGTNMASSVPRSPLLMLRPSFEIDGMVYNFYSLAQKKVLRHPKISREGSESPDNGAEFVGSSHGWLALFNRRNDDLFLSNPLSGRHIKLPPIELLRVPRNYGTEFRVNRVVLSSSPDVEGCWAMMTFTPGNRLAFCSPGRSWRWCPLLPRILVGECTYEFPSICEDFIYCNRRKVLTYLLPCEFDLVSFDFRSDISERPIENWDIGNPAIDDCHACSSNHPFEFWDNGYPLTDVCNIVKPLDLKNIGRGKKASSWVEENRAILEERCVQIPHLVYAPDQQLYLVLRFVEAMDLDCYMPIDRPIEHLSAFHPCKTFGFIVFRVDEDGCYEAVDDLNGLAIFVGINNSLALPVADSDSGSSELKPNSIYYTTARRISLLYGSDTGIFDYEYKTISPIIDPDDDASRLLESFDYSSTTTQRVESSTLWF